jgi:hypothetical protein
MIEIMKETDTHVDLHQEMRLIILLQEKKSMMIIIRNLLKSKALEIWVGNC